MATAPGIKGNPLYANSDEMAGPAQISAVSAWAADHIGEHADTVAELPSTGNWPGRHVYVTAVGDYVWAGSLWVATPVVVSAEISYGANITAVSGYGVYATRAGRSCTLSGILSVASGAAQTNLGQLPAWAIPAGLPASQLTFIGSMFTGNPSHLAGALYTSSAGVLQVSQTYGNITSLPIGSAAIQGAWNV